MIQRTISEYIRKSIGEWPVTLITGARQVGKTTLCREICKDMGFEYVSLDDYDQRKAAQETPALFLQMHKCPLIIDEIQQAPGLFDAINHKVNQQKFETGDNYGMFLLTGSNSYGLMKGVTESMAGRVNIMELNPLSTSEILGLEEKPFVVDIGRISERVAGNRLDANDLYDLIVCGMYPELHVTDKDREEFYGNYVDTYLQRDVSLMINLKDRNRFTDLLTYLASITGCELVYESAAKTVGVSSNTVKSWVSILEAGHIIRLVKPYYETKMSQRIVRHPKVYFCDTGLVCSLLGILTGKVLSANFFKGRIVETYIFNEIAKSYCNNGRRPKLFYYRDNNGNEIDIVVMDGSVFHLVECKSGTSFTKADVKGFRQMHASSYEIGSSCIICNTEQPYPIDEGVYVLPILSI